MPPSLFDPDAERTVSVMINSDLYAKATAAEIDLSEVAERAIIDAFRAQVRSQVEHEVAWIDAYESEHGSFAQLMHEYREEREANASV